MGCLQNLPTAGRDQAQDCVLPRTTHGLTAQCPLRLWATFKGLVLRGLPPSWLASFVSQDSGFLWVFLASSEMGELIECCWVPPFLSLVLGSPSCISYSPSLNEGDLWNKLQLQMQDWEPVLLGDLPYPVLVTLFSAGIRWSGGRFQGRLFALWSPPTPPPSI